MKQKSENTSVVQDLCRQLKIQLDELSVTSEEPPKLAQEEKSRRSELMEQLKEQLAELSR